MTGLGEHFKINQNNLINDPSMIFTGKYYRITVLSDRLIRLEYSLNGEFYDGLTEIVHNRHFAKTKIEVTQSEKYLTINTKYFNLKYAKEKPFKGPAYAPDANLKVKLHNTDKVWYYNHPEARNFKGSAFSIEEFGGETPLSKGLYSTDGFATLDDSNSLFIDTDGYIVPNSTKRTDLYLFAYRRDFGLCLRDYFNLTGYPPLLPRYALGIWWYKDQIYSFENTKKLVQTFNKHEIPLSVLLLGEFWHRKDKNNYNLYKTGYDFNLELFPEPKEFTKYMHERGIKVGVNLDGSEGITSNVNAYMNMCTELNYPTNKVIPFKVLDKNFIDSYFKNLINPLYELGIDFFWLDSKDEIVTRVLNYYHFNDYKKFPDKRGMIFSRNGGRASHNYPVHYSGMTKVGWDTLKFLPYFNLTASNIGLSWWSHDIGGFKGGIEDGELYLRYVELACYSPIFRFSSERGNFYKREPWRWDMKTYTIVKDYCKLRHRLIPYIYTENYNYYKTCLPLIEPLYYYNPELYDEPDYRNEYYFGSEFLIAPITKPKDTVMNRSVEKIFLPKGIWYDFKTGKKFIGGKRYVTFYKDEDYPVFVKAGSIVPLQQFEENINNTNSPKKLDINIFPGNSNTYKLYEDDGISSLYEEGYYIVTSINFTYAKDDYTLEIKPIEGKTGIIPEERDYQVKFRNTRTPDRVIVEFNGERIKDYESYQDENDFIILVKNISTKGSLLINCVGYNIEIDALRIVNEEVFDIISDLKIETLLKEKIGAIMFNTMPINKKRIAIRKLKSTGLDPLFIKMFIKLLEYMEEI